MDMFKKNNLLTLLILVTCSFPVFGKSLHVKHISKDLRMVVIADNAKIERKLWKGDRFDEWIIVDIQPERIILHSEPDPITEMVTRMILNVPASRETIIEDDGFHRKK
jgi:hypothetical protein